MKKLIIAVVVILAVIGGIFYWSQKPSPEVVNSSPTSTGDYKNISYNIDGQTIQFKNGLSEMNAAPDAVEIVTTEYFGNEVRGDFNNDGTEDVAFLMVQSGGGTGAFFYVVAALKTADGYKGTNGVFLGDRIAPQTTEFRNSQIIVNYADRKPNEPLSAEPSVGVSKYLKIVGDQLIEISP